MRKIFIVLMVLIMACPVYAGLKTEEVVYQAEGINFKGYLAYNDSVEGKRPGILVVHEWWGHNSYARKRAEMLADLGYVAFAVDMFGDGKTADHPEDAKKFVAEVLEKEGGSQKRFVAAMNILKKRPQVDKTKLGAIGYCFGGSTVLNMARQGIDLKGVVSFHGSLATQTPAQKGKVKARVLVCHGADDNFIPPQDIAEFKKEMEQAKVNYTFIAYEGAKHSFTNPEADMFAEKFGMGVAYNEAADQQSWAHMRDFFEDIFKKGHLKNRGVLGSH